jgi:hypothetical protein
MARPAWQILRQHQVLRPKVVIEEAERARLPLHFAIAMLEKETDIPQRNIFGCDHGPGRAFCHENVTAARVAALRRSGLANGVGWAQLTFPAFVEEADRLGGAHKPRFQMRVGFKVLKDNMERQGTAQQGFRAYNGTGPDAEKYGREAIEIAKRWKRILSSGT